MNSGYTIISVRAKSPKLIMGVLPVLLHHDLNEITTHSDS